MYTINLFENDISEHSNDIFELTLIYTDGSNTNNGQPHSIGGAAYLVVEDNKIKHKGGLHMQANPRTPVTNNLAEMTAIHEALKWIVQQPPEPKKQFVIRSDSKYVVDGINGKTKLVKNLREWASLFKAKKKAKETCHKVNIMWVKGHADDQYNIAVDKLANHFRQYGDPSKINMDNEQRKPQA